MMLLWILAGVALLPMTMLLFLVFNLVLLNFGYFLITLLFLFLYADMWGTLFASWPVTYWLFLCLLVLYVLRMVYCTCVLAHRMYPAVRCHIRTKYSCFHTLLFIPLSYLNLLKWIPMRVSKELLKHTHFTIDELVDQLISCSVGTKIEIKHDDVDVTLEVQ